MPAINPTPDTRVIDLQAPVRYVPSPRITRPTQQPLNLAAGSTVGRMEEAAGHLWAAYQLIESILSESDRFRFGLLREAARLSRIFAELCESTARTLHKS